MSRPPITRTSRPVSLVMAGILVAACGSGDDSTSVLETEPVETEPVETEVAEEPEVSDVATTSAPPLTTTTTSTTTSSTTTSTTTTTTIPVDPWRSVPAPPPPTLTPRPGFESLADVATICVRVEHDDRTTATADRFGTILGALGYTVIADPDDAATANACDAVFTATLAGEAGPVSYGDDLTCYLDRDVTGTLDLTVAGDPVAAWPIDEHDDPPLAISELACTGPDDPVSVAFWSNAFNDVAYEIWGNVGIAAYAVTRHSDLTSVWGVVDGVEGEAAFLADPQVMQLFAAYLGDEPLTDDQLWFVEDITASIARRDGTPPAGVEVLLPHLLRSVTSHDMDYREASIDRGWDAIAWITGVPERDARAAWAWYEEHVGTTP